MMKYFIAGQHISFGQLYKAKSNSSFLPVNEGHKIDSKSISGVI